MTTIQGSLSLPLGLSSVATGSIKVSWVAFADAGGNYYPASYAVVPVAADNSYNFSLPSNAGATPFGTYYTATYYSRAGVQLGTEQWIVPDVTGGPLTIPEIKVNQSIPALPFQIQARQLYSADAKVGDVLVFDGANYTPATLQSIHPFEFASQQSVTITQQQHGQGLALIVQYYTTTGQSLDATEIVDPFTGDVTLNFSEVQSGYGFIYGGLARSLPNYARSFFNVPTATITQAQHRFNTPNLIIVVRDASGQRIDSDASVQISPTFDVTVGLGEPAQFTVTVAGCLGTTVTPISLNPQPYTTSITAAGVIAAATHGKGATALLSGFSSTGQSIAVDYQRDANGDLTLDPNYRGAVQVTSGGYQGDSAPFLLPVSTLAGTVNVFASMHNQGPYALPFGFDANGSAVEFDYTRDALGNITCSFSPGFEGTVEVIAGGWRGHSLYTKPVSTVSSVLISASEHAQGINALVAFFNADATPTSASADWARSASGDISVTFDAPFSGLIQVYRPE